MSSSKLAVIVVSRNRPDLVQSMVARLKTSLTVAHDLFVVECGTDSEKLTPHTSLWYPDPDFRGKCFGHNAGLAFAKLRDRYDYYWFLMNDLVFEDGIDPARVLIDTLERNERMAILSPTNAEGGYPAASPRAGGDFRAVTTCDYLGFMMKASALDECGFLNPDFKYCWGAIHELSHKLYAQGWFVAYSDRVAYKHLGGATYGAKGTNTISREEYQRLAKRFAYDYFRVNYGDDWEQRFWNAAARFAPEVDTYREHKELWASAFTADELAERGHGRPRRPASLVPAPAPGSKRLHLGCGPEKREGWINVDTQAALKPDVVAEVDKLSMFGEGSIDAIEANHLFEHLTLHDARRALREWARVLRPGGELFLEMPDLDSCIRILGKYKDDHGLDLGLIGIYGWPPGIEREGVPQIHKWGWTRTTLREELNKAGFEAIEFGPITQTWRPAAKVGRDLRLRAVRARQPIAKPVAGVAAQPTAATAEASARPIALATEKAFKAFAWPAWNDRAELERLLATFGRELAGRDDGCLVLRFDERVDGSRDAALAALSQAHAKTLGGRPLEVLILDDAFGPESWPVVGRLISCAIALASAKSDPRRAALIATGAPLVVEPGDLRAWLAPRAAQPLPAEHAELQARVRALDPWFYPLRVGPLDVVAGIGSPVTHEFLVNHTHQRATLLVDEVRKRVDLAGKSVLELACNCGYWSSRYVELGATRVVGMEGRAQFLAQAELFWGTNGLLPRERRRFLPGNVADERDWAQLRALAPFDVTLIAGILYHVPNYRDVLRWAAEVTRDALVIDTRIGDGAEPLVDEPGELRFNAIEATRRKVVPALDKLLAALGDVGFAAEVLPVRFAEMIGVQDVDSFARGNRVAILARRVHAPLPQATRAPAAAGAAVAP